MTMVLGWFCSNIEQLAEGAKDKFKRLLVSNFSVLKSFHQLFLWSWRYKIFSPFQSKALVTVEKYFGSFGKLQVILSLTRMSMLCIHIHLFSFDGCILRDLSVIYEHCIICKNLNSFSHLFSPVCLPHFLRNKLEKGFRAAVYSD